MNTDDNSDLIETTDPLNNNEIGTTEEIEKKRYVESFYRPTVAADSPYGDDEIVLDESAPQPTAQTTLPGEDANFWRKLLTQLSGIQRADCASDDEYLNDKRKILLDYVRKHKQII